MEGGRPAGPWPGLCRYTHHLPGRSLSLSVPLAAKWPLKTQDRLWRRPSAPRPWPAEASVVGGGWEAPGWSAGPLASRVRWVASPAQTTTAGSRHQVALSPPQRCSPVLPTFRCHSHQVGHLDHRQWCPREEVQSKQVCGPGLAPGSWVGQEQSHHVWSAAPLTVGILQVAQGFPWDLVRI